MRRSAAAVALAPLLIAAACGGAEAPDRPGTESSAQEVATDPGIVVEYVAHAAFLLHASDGTELLIDPYASRVWLGYDWPEGIEPDAVLITHPHYDHDAGRYRGMPFPWGPDVPVVEAAGLRIVHLGDNGPLMPERVEELGRVDVLMLPADGVDHILSEGTTAEILEQTDLRIVIPMHYRLPNLERDPDSPSDLGEIEPWLEGRDGVRRVGGHRTTLRVTELPDSREILVFEHAPYVLAPAG